jgi:hypothetical protein
VSAATQYEFSRRQNAEIGSLAGKMRFVGLLAAASGVIALLVCLVTVLFLFRDRLPGGFREKAAEYYKKARESLPDDLKKQAGDYSLDKIPTDNNFLTGLAIFTRHGADLPAPGHLDALLGGVHPEDGGHAKP